MKYSALAALALTLLASATQAAPYVSLKGEYAVSGNSDASIASSALNASADADYDSGYGGSAAFGGYLFGSIRGEVEGGYHQLNVDTVTVGGTTLSGNDDETKLYSAMGNLYLDIGNSSAYTPYIGVGAGMAREADSHETAPAYQAMAGVSARVANGTSLLLGYKYFRTGDFKDDINDPILGTGNEEFNAQAHIVEGGIKYNF